MGGQGLNAHSYEGLAPEPLSRVAGLLRTKLTEIFPERDAGCPLKELPLFPLGKWGRGQSTDFVHIFVVCGHALYRRQQVLKSRENFHFFRHSTDFLLKLKGPQGGS